jgi:hypothetical protein
MAVPIVTMGAARRPMSSNNLCACGNVRASFGFDFETFVHEGQSPVALPTGGGGGEGHCTLKRPSPPLVPPTADIAAILYRVIKEISAVAASTAATAACACGGRLRRSWRGQQGPGHHAQECPQALILVTGTLAAVFPPDLNQLRFSIQGVL